VKVVENKDLLLKRACNARLQQTSLASASRKQQCRGLGAG